MASGGRKEIVVNIYTWLIILKFVLKKEPTSWESFKKEKQNSLKENTKALSDESCSSNGRVSYWT